MKNPKLQTATLYGILDTGYCDASAFARTAAEMAEGGIDIVQLRAKGADEQDILNWAKLLKPIFADHQVPFIINDFPQIAAEIGADGIHVGQDDQSMDDVRTIVGDDMIVGRSTHSVEQAAAAAADERTDYIGFGPLFATPTKPTYQPIGTAEIAAVHREHPELPIFCIGGIKKENTPSVIKAGAKRVVIVSGILQAPSISAYVRETKSILSAGS